MADNPDQTGITITAFDPQLLKKPGDFRLTDVKGAVGGFLIRNDDQFAFNTESEMVLLPMSLVESPVPHRERPSPGL